MSSAADDEKSLLEVIRVSVGSYELASRISNRIYPYTSYILKNVTTLRLDGSKLGVPGASHEGVSESKVAELNFITSDFHDIGYILNKIGSSSSTHVDEHELALLLPGLLRAPRQPSGSVYSMNFILVGTLAAFAVTHGVWLLCLKFVCANSIEEDIMKVLKGVERLFITLRRNQGRGETDYHLDFYIYISLLSSSITTMPKDDWKSMDSLYSLITAMFEVVSVAHLFLEDVYDHIPKPLNDEFDHLMLLSIYWVTRGVLVCSSQCNELPKNGYVIHDSQKLTYVREKLVSVHERLRELDDNGKQYIDDLKFTDAYQIPGKKGQDNYFALMALFGLQPYGSHDVKLSHCSGKNADFSLKTLRHKSLVLLISGLNISSNVISYLKDVYDEYMTLSVHEADWEFIWLPVHSGPWMEDRYTKLLQTMPWYTVHHPTNYIKEGTKKFIRDIWMFHKKPIAVVLNGDGNVVCPNAMHMMYIWSVEAFPFTRMRERTLWKAETRLSSTVLGHMFKQFEASKCIILYGGSDIEWIKRFISCILEISSTNDLGSTMMMIHIAKNAESENIREIISSLVGRNTPETYYPDSKQTWYYWKRLESLLISRYQSAANYAMDPLIREVKGLLTYCSAESWACLITPPSNLIVHGLGNTMLQGFMQFDSSTPSHLRSKDFSIKLLNHIEQIRQSRATDLQPCKRIVLDIDNKDVIHSLECPDCNHFMEKKVQHRCCHTDE